MPKILVNYLIKNESVVLLKNECVFPDLPLAIVEYSMKENIDNPVLISTKQGYFPEIISKKTLDEMMVNADEVIIEDENIEEKKGE